MDPITRARILADREHLTLTEARCVRVQRERIHEIRLSHAWRKHGAGSPLEITVRPVENAVDIHWNKRDSHRKWRLTAYREEGGFDAKRNRVQIVDSLAQEDALLDQVEEGKAFYFTFQLSCMTLFGALDGEPVRFSVTVPLSTLSETTREARRRAQAASAFADEEATKRRWERERGDADQTEARRARFENSIAFEALKERIKLSIAASDMVERYRMLKKELLNVQGLVEAGEIDKNEYETLVAEIKDLFEG